MVESVVGTSKRGRQLFLTALTYLSCLLAGSVVNANEKVTLQLKWKHQFQFAGYYAALKEGFFQEEGLDVNIREVVKGKSAVDVVLSNEAQYGISDSSLVLSRLRGQPVVVLAAIFQHSPLVLLTLESEGILSPLQLRGKRVMYQKNIDDAVLLAMFSEMGLGSDDHIHVPHSFDYRSLLNGEVDAFSAYTTNQPYFFEQLDVPINIMSPANYGIDFYGDMLFVEESYLKNNREQVLAFRRATLKGWLYALENQEELVDWMLANLPMEKSRDHLLYEAEKTARLIQPELVELGYVNPNRFTRIASIYKKQGLAAMDSELAGIEYQTYFEKHYDARRWLTIAGFALLVFAVLVTALWIFNTRLKSQVRSKTRDLYVANKNQKNYLDLINRYVMAATADTQGTIMSVSDAFCREAGYAADELVGQTYELLYHPDTDPVEVKKVREQIKGDGQWSGELRFQTKKKQDLWLKYDISPRLNEENTISGYTAIYENITDRKRVELLSVTDTLTGLSNRRHLDEVLKNNWQSAKRYARPFTIILMDLDHFKKVNDNYGHLIGDEILKGAGEIIKRHTRSTDVPGRWGGEEFLIICPETELKGGVTLAEQLRVTIARTEFTSVRTQTSSFGVAQWRTDESIDDLLERADQCLYKAKEQGRNCVLAEQ